MPTPRPTRSPATDFTGFVISNTTTRPADTTAYGSGDLVANSTTAGSVVPIKFSGLSASYGSVVRLDRCRIRKTGTSVTSASFRVHFYSALPVPSNGDNLAWLTPVTDYIGACDVTLDRVFTNGAEGAGLPLSGSPIVAKLDAGKDLYALIEARAGYTPVSAEVFTVMVEGYRL